MKKVALLLLFLIPAFAPAQKITFKEGFFKTKYFLGSDQTTKPALDLHLEKNATTKVFSDWQAFRRASRNAVVWDIVGAAGILGAFVLSTNETRLASAGVGVVGCSGLLVCTINANRHRKRALNGWNASH